MKKDYVSLLLILGFAVGFAQSVVRGPYLQKSTETSVIVRWRTDVNDTSVIEYSTDSGFASFSTISNTTSKTEHQIEIMGLTSGTKYYYRLGTSGSLVSGATDLFFKTHPTLGSTDLYRFWFLGHTGNGSATNTTAVNVRDQYYSYIGSNDTDGIFLTGDNGGSQGNDQQYQASVFGMFDDKLKNSMLWSCIGNLDGPSSDTATQTGTYYDVFNFPTSGESGGMASGTESYYSFDYGNIHFIVLNSFDEDRSIGGTMYNWALNDIQNTTQKWIVALWHHPPYSGGWHPSEGLDFYGVPAEVQLIEMRENFIPMLESNGVDLVVGGHCESYERSYLINGHYGLSASFDLSIHAVGVTGSGDGKSSGDGVYSKSEIGDDAGLGTVYTVLSNSATSVTKLFNHNAIFYSPGYSHGSCVLEVEGNNLTLRYINESGTEEDNFTIHKGPDYVYDNGWQDGNNPNGIATNLEDLIVVSGDATISSNTTFNTIVVNPGATLTIDSGVTLTANSILLESDSNSYSSLNPDATSTVNASTRYDRFVNQVGSVSGSGNDLVSSPVSGGTMETFSDFADWNKNLAASNDLRAFAPYNNVSGNYENYDIVVNELTLLEAAKGYRSATNDGSVVSFKGDVNIGNVSTTISIGASNYWNLVGNPYTSYINSQEFLSINGASGNDVFDASHNAIYGYNSGTDGSGIWTIINNVQNTGKNIAPGQGFFVASNGTGGTNNLSFTPAMRTISGADDFILGRNDNSNTSFAHLGLKMVSTSKVYTTDFYFTDMASTGLDVGYDAGSLDATNANFSLYSHLVDDNTGIDMAIQALSLTDLANVIVPLGVNLNANESVTISIEENELPGNTYVYLEDNDTNSFTLLNSNDYTFTASTDLSGTGRFYLHYSNSTLSIEINEINSLQIFTTDKPNVLNINGSLKDESIVTLYDVQGRSVLSQELDHRSHSNLINVEHLNSGVYIVKLEMGEKLRTEKIILK
ncbi:MAG: metallophosphoesterase [Winogradskyella sp.]|uniref:fibronectin type III domain-containing protein n=1 Tax=Winogradskyella sp. TaxID=1883156 RepID=UPI0025D2EC22|nr:fibronectin type III domain-containing protein [Winogradskyella sp.]NRB58953.1 metallophosphoesterase [Winogradskyella sp.]